MRFEIHGPRTDGRSLAASATNGRWPPGYTIAAGTVLFSPRQLTYNALCERQLFDELRIGSRDTSQRDLRM